MLHLRSAERRDGYACRCAGAKSAVMTPVVMRIAAMIMASATAVRTKRLVAPGALAEMAGP